MIRDEAMLRRLSEVGPPQTRALRTATAAIAIVLPVRDDHVTGDVYDDGRAAERLLIAASMLGLGAGIQWIRDDVLEAVQKLLGLPPDRRVRTIIALGYPSEAARQPKTAPGEATAAARRGDLPRALAGVGPPRTTSRRPTGSHGAAHATRVSRA